MNTARDRGRICVLLSGGLDSALLAAHYLERGWRVLPVYVSAGLRWEKAELHWARRLLKKLAVPALEPLQALGCSDPALYGPGHWALGGPVPGASARWDSVWLPGRNLLLLSRAGALCSRRGVDRLALGVLRGNPFLDARPEFFRAMERTLKACFGRPMRVETPFARRSKEELIRLRPEAPWELTFSCIDPVRLRHCGKCAKCFERRRAFRRAGRADPTPYAS